MRTSKRATAARARLMLAFATALAATVSAACATASTSAAPDTTPEVLIDESGRVYRTTGSPTATSFATSPDSTFKAVVAAYATLGLQTTTTDATARVVAGKHLLFRSRFLGQPLSAVFDCGAGQFGPRADQGRILADVTTQIVPAGTGSAVSTTIEASITLNDGVSRDPIRCVSRGRIEERIRREATLQLGLRYEAP